ncbi:Endonuclease/exonuclease/phosphatase [Ephemerocybe angulata]|uniref:Endonuclease/exonuclease/phosphatase n=1 Tax=Ephemerocybe angulata TaxID=980116 RepID=A0A8H6M0A4_9AGAR|nr:Endonuclease/exonuclease/phosphatase [Tulosesus angulatus]
MGDQDEVSLAVSSLRSRFEQLAAGSGLKSSADAPPLSPRPGGTFPRARAASNNSLTVDSTIHALRASSSSSDLKSPVSDVLDPKSAALKRPPPPPPTRAKPSVSPAPSPLTRPVPLPPSASNGNGNGNGNAARADVREMQPGDLASMKGPFYGGSALRSTSMSISKPPVPPVPPRPTFMISESPENGSSRQRRSESPLGFAEREAETQAASPPKLSRSNSNPVEDLDYTTDPSSPSPAPPPAPPPRSSRPGLPPPPPRHRTSRSPQPDAPSNSNLPPPLPHRRPTVPYLAPPENRSSPSPRRSTMAKPAVAQPLPETPSDSSSPSPNGDRKPLSKFQPPPTRTIALGDKLPAARRAAEGSSDDEEGPEEDASAASRIVDTIPDSSSSSRRLPTLSFRPGFPPPQLRFHPHSGCVIASGPNLVVSHVHHIKIYNLEISDAPLYDLDMKQLGMKDTKVLSMEFSPSMNKEDRGAFVWMGTKDGSILELDIRSGALTATKPSAHLHPVCQMFRHGRSMVSLDESGKALIFSPDPEHPEQDVSLTYTTPRAVRTTDKTDFVKLLDGKLWTASRTEHSGGGSLGRVVPIIRVFDIFNTAAPGKSIMPSEHCGQVTSATILPTEPDRVYMGHEEGYVSIWNLDTDDGWPSCTEVTKVSTSDIMCLEGVNERLWAGSRNGLISAYDVRQTPWIMTNQWQAHNAYPVLKIFVNFRAIETNQKLCVVSLGRDELVKLWDGLLGVDWVENELVKNESSFSTFQDINALVVSWNCDAARPESLNDGGRNAEFFTDVFSSVTTPPDIISFSFQEVIDLESRKMAAKNMLLGGKKKDDALSDRVTGAYKRWHDKFVSVVKAAFGPLGVEYTAVLTESMVGLFSCLFVRNTNEFVCREKHIAAIKRGMGGRYGNKGAVIARVVIGDSSLCFINCHLAAGQHAIKQRNSDIAAILEEKGIFEPSPLETAYVRGGDGTMVLDHEFVLVNGDLNYRIDVTRRETYLSSFRSGDLSNLLAHDQLLQQMRNNKTFRLRGFSEGPITFLPTYKYDPRSDEYDTSEKRRHPAWCDRILWKAREADRMQQLSYKRYEVNVSDHRPISATFVIRVKNIQTEARERAKAIVEAAWADEQMRILDSAQKFYVRQALM